MTSNEQAKPTHPIQVVARRTGLTQDTLRAWEKRYRAVEPERTPTGRRVYSDEDVERLQLLRRATLGGRSIGQVAELPTSELRELVVEDEAQSAERFVPAVRRAGSQTPAAAGAEELLQACLTAVEELDPDALESTLARAHVALSGPALLDQVISPLMEQVGENWRRGVFRVAHEHLSTAVLRNFLGRIWESSSLPAEAPTLIATTPTGQVHELGVLVAATVAAAEGWNVLYLGPNTPAQDVAAAAIQKSARVVALSLVYPVDDPRLPDELRIMAEHLPAETTLIVGGRAAESLRAQLGEVGAEVMTDIQDFRVRLESLRAVR
jgi:methanogenic corrinoid protein MtbC1